MYCMRSRLVVRNDVCSRSAFRMRTGIGIRVGTRCSCGQTRLARVPSGLFLPKFAAGQLLALQQMSRVN